MAASAAIHSHALTTGSSGADRPDARITAVRSPTDLLDLPYTFTQRRLLLTDQFVGEPAREAVC
jgi:hypothetical protein